MPTLPLSDGECLLLVLIALYLVDGITWVPAGSVVFATNPLSRSYRAQRGRIFSSDRGGYKILWPLPGIHGMICQPWPLALSPQGISAHGYLDGGEAPQSPVYYEWDDVASVVVRERDVLINDRVLARACSASAAYSLRDIILDVQDHAIHERAAAIDRLLATVNDTAEVESRLAQLHRCSRFGNQPALGMWLIALVVLPCCMWSMASQPASAAVLSAGSGLFVLLWSLQVTMYYGAVRRLRKYLNDGTIPNRTWMMCLSPIEAMWASDRLARELLSRFHPLAVASVLLTPDQFHELARRTLRDLHFPLRPVIASEERQHESDEWFRQRQLVAFELTVREAGSSIEELLAPPKPEDELVRAYCPRCESQYQLQRGFCHTCTGVALRPFDSIATTSNDPRA